MAGWLLPGGRARSESVLAPCSTLNTRMASINRAHRLGLGVPYIACRCQTPSRMARLVLNSIVISLHVTVLQPSLPVWMLLLHFRHEWSFLVDALLAVPSELKICEMVCCYGTKILSRWAFSSALILRIEECGDVSMQIHRNLRGWI